MTKLADLTPDQLTRHEWDQSLLRKFGIGATEYDLMFEEQGGVCAICSEPPKSRRLAVDHDHLTGKVRGLLCQGCNRALGWFGDSRNSLLNAAEYLDRHEHLNLDV